MAGYIKGTRLEGKVAQILNARQLVINLGTQDGIRLGMRFAVLAATPLEIVDPDSHEVLGIVDREKVRVAAVEVQERFAICSTYEIKVVGEGADVFTGLSALRWLTPRQEIPKTLEISDDASPSAAQP